MVALINHEHKSRSLVSHFVSKWWHETLLVSVTHWIYVKLSGWYIKFNENYCHLVDCSDSLPTEGLAERFIPFSRLFLWVVILQCGCLVIRCIDSNSLWRVFHDCFLVFGKYTCDWQSPEFLERIASEFLYGAKSREPETDAGRNTAY